MACGRLVGCSMTQIVSAAEIHGGDGLAFVAEFTADGQPCLQVLGFLFWGQRAGLGPAGSRAWRSVQFLVSTLGIGVG